jgi:mannan endo-1,4-beta-mannosidase
MPPFARRRTLSAAKVTGSAARKLAPRRGFADRLRRCHLLHPIVTALAIMLAVSGVTLSGGVGPGRRVAVDQPAGEITQGVTSGPAAPATTNAAAAVVGEPTTTGPVTPSSIAHPVNAAVRSLPKPVVPIPPTTPPAPASTTTRPPTGQAAAPGLVARQGTQLLLNGQPYVFRGLNAYELATVWGTNTGCGPQASDAELATLFASLPAHSVVRVWAWQGSMAADPHTGQRTWTGLDRVVNAARASGQKLIFALAGQGGSCDDGHWQDRAWYLGGYRNRYNDDGRGLAATSYWSWMQDVVTRYRSAPEIAMWEPVSEAEASDCPSGLRGTQCEGHQTCPDEQSAADALRSFYDTVGGEIHRIDPLHLVESGALGSGQCGMVWNDYEYVHASPGIDVASVHDYGFDDTPLPGDRWNGEKERLAQAADLGKPVILGEIGIKAAQAVSGCADPSQRAGKLLAKIRAAETAGFSGTAVWDWIPAGAHDSGCSYDVSPGDPLLAALSA